ncbi:MAG: type II toxin-antitoxin system VapC family toxin [Pirellulaceae bacterium]|nr:type II toxin-antitoxin system VapC family toxin [Pirellulaceae bacterium]
MKYLLDTNICVFVIRQKPLVVVEKFKQFVADELAISSVTLAELRYGADKSSDTGKNHAALDLFLAPLAIVDFDSQAAERYGVVRADLERRGLPIGPLDTMIAAHALRLVIPLVTNNTREFARVGGLLLEDWASKVT